MRVAKPYSRVLPLRHAPARTKYGIPGSAISGVNTGSYGEGKPSLSPRCGKPMTPYETAAQPTLWGEERACGRPEGHRGPCRSAAAVARYYAADVVRIAETRRSRSSGWPVTREAAA